MTSDTALLEGQNILLATIKEMHEDIKRLKRQANDLWGIQEIADHLGLSYNTVQCSTTKNRTFPNPLYIPSPTSQKGTKRWKAKEIMAWAERHKAR